MLVFEKKHYKSNKDCDIHVCLKSICTYAYGKIEFRLSE